MCIIIACYLFTGLGCRGNGHSRDGSPLPDPAWKGREHKRSRFLLKDARDFCKRAGNLAMREDVLSRAQCEAALHALNREQDLGTQPPIALFSATGLMANGQPYLTLFVVNTNRETSRGHILARGPNGDFVHIVYDFQPWAKEQTYRWMRLLRAEYVPWEILRERASAEEDGHIHFIVQEGTNGNIVPFPDISVAKVCVAVEDRSGRMSNFVPVRHLDMNQKPSVQSVEKGKGQDAEGLTGTVPK